MSAPVVTGLSPIEGVPGTKLTIRGENLGNHPHDLIGLLICGVDCLLTAEWKSNTKIIARSGGGIGKGDVIVSTATGGMGTCTVQFKGYQEVLSAVKESAVWVDESVILNMSFGRQRPLSPTAMMQDDPLGLSVEGNITTELDVDLPSLFPSQNGDLSSNSFNPAWFLLEQHRSTGFLDLKAGMQHLERKVNNQKEGQISFLKANVGSVLEQLNTLLELKDSFDSDSANTKETIQVLDSSISECKKEADKLFEDVLQRKDRADSTRNALNILHRFRFLLYLPLSIERNMELGQYDIIINDYARAKSLFGDTHIELFKQFSNEVELRIEKLRQVLQEELRKLPATLEHHKKVIRNLQHLENSGDPAWEAIKYRQEYCISLLSDTQETHLTRELADRDHGTTNEDISKRFISSTVRDYQMQAPVRVFFIESVCDVLSEHYPDLWRLSQAYFGGELSSPDAPHIDSTKQPECKQLLLGIMEYFAHVVRDSILDASKYHERRGSYDRVWPDSQVSVLTPWMPQIIRLVRRCYSALLPLDLPNDALDLITSLLFDLRVQCLQWLLQQTVEHVKALHSKEDWQLKENYSSGDNPGYTSLCLTFESVVLEACQLVKEVVLETDGAGGTHTGHHELSLISVDAVRKDLSTLLHNVVIAFAQCLEKLCLSDPDDSAPSPHPLTSVERQLLITFSNCAHTRQNVLAKIEQTLVKIGYPEKEVREGIGATKESYKELEARLLEAYLEERSDPVIGMIERSMYLGGFEWCRLHIPPTDVRNYVKEIFLNITDIQAEVLSVWPGSCHSLLSRVIEGVAEEMSRLLSCVSDWSGDTGVTQANTDLTALLTCLEKYITPTARSSFEEALELLPNLNAEQEKQKQKALLNFHSKMSLMLSSFK